jgi:ribonuclease HI
MVCTADCKPGTVVTEGTFYCPSHAPTRGSLPPPTQADEEQPSLEQELVLHFDGGSRNNPGIAGAGWVLDRVTPNSNEHLLSRALFLGVATNNEAEFTACLDGVETVRQLAEDDDLPKFVFNIVGDSQLLVHALEGKSECRDHKLLPLLATIRAHIAELTSRGCHVAVQHKRREQWRLCCPMELHPTTRRPFSKCKTCTRTGQSR